MGESESSKAFGGSPFATEFHSPVLCHAVVEGLVTNPAGLYVDATLGGGGHSEALLAALGPEGRVIGIDQDAEALAEATSRLGKTYPGQFLALAGNFGYLDQLLGSIAVHDVDGVLMDLGVSSHQIDDGARGFSFMKDGPLDMRMDQSTDMCADDLVNTWTVQELTHVIREFGEERRAARIARGIAEHRPLHTTAELARVVERLVPGRESVKTLARVYQALRIVVNAELKMLEQGLAAALEVLRVGGRVAVISYHSLEDRRAKRFLQYGNLTGVPVRDFYGNLITPWDRLTRKPIVASPEEVRANPRARSARLRIAEKRDSSDNTGPLDQA